MKTVKLFIIVSIAILSVCNCKPSSKNGFTIKGEIENGVEIDTVEIYYDLNLMNPVAFGFVKDNKFVIKGAKVDTIVQAFIGSNKIGLFSSFVLDNEDYTCKISRQNIIVRGGRINEVVYGKMADGEGAKLNAEYEDIMNRGEALDENDIEAQDKLEEEMIDFGRRRANFYNSHTETIIEGNYPAETKIVALTMNSDSEKYPQEKRLEMIAEYEKAMGANHPLLREYKQQLEFMKEQQEMSGTVEIGTPFKPVTASDRNGNHVNLADIVAKNEYTLLEFWASWCSPCRAEIPNLKNAYAKYRSKGFEIYSISLDEKQSDWLKALDKEKTPWINLNDPKGFNSPISRSYGINGIPAGFLISKEGKIIESNDALRGGKLGILLEKLLK